MEQEIKPPPLADEDVRSRVEERIRFLTHFTYFVGLAGLFVVIDYVAGGTISWSLYIAGVWGAFVYLHFLSAFVIADLRGPFRRWLLRRERDKRTDAAGRGRGTPRGGRE